MICDLKKCQYHITNLNENLFSAEVNGFTFYHIMKYNAGMYLDCLYIMAVDVWSPLIQHLTCIYVNLSLLLRKLIQI